MTEPQATEAEPFNAAEDVIDRRVRPGRDGPAALAEEIHALVKREQAPDKYPRWVEFVPARPNSATGKTQRFRLRG
jgi:benzoate-CoA ligase